MNIYKHYGIYGIKNKINSKIYIGKTMKSFGDRWDCHKAQLRGGYHDNPHLQRAWKKYGEGNFSFIVLVDCVNGETHADVNKLEVQEIAKYRDLGLAYNIHDGGDGGLFLGKHLSERAKRKIGDKNRVHMLGRHATDETRKKMSESQLKRYSRWTSEDRKQWSNKLSECLTGIKKPTLSTKLKGNKHGAKYSLEQIREIRRLYNEEHKTFAEISNMMKIPRQTVYGIATYRRWADTI